MLILTGTVIGFLFGIALGLSRRTDWPSAFLHAAAAAAALGLLTKWWSGVWLNGLRASHQQRRLAEAVARQQTQSTSAKKP